MVYGIPAGRIPTVKVFYVVFKKELIQCELNLTFSLT